MRFKETIFERIPPDELYKVSVMTFYLKPIEESSKRLTFQRDDAPSSFYNSADIVCGSLYKHTSLIVGNFYEKEK